MPVTSQNECGCIQLSGYSVNIVICCTDFPFHHSSLLLPRKFSNYPFICVNILCLDKSSYKLKNQDDRKYTCYLVQHKTVFSVKKTSQLKIIWSLRKFTYVIKWTARILFCFCLFVLFCMFVFFFFVSFFVVVVVFFSFFFWLFVSSLLSHDKVIIWIQARLT